MPNYWIFANAPYQEHQIDPEEGCNMDFDVKTYKGTETYETVRDGIEIARVFSCHYRALDKKESNKVFVALYPHLRFNNATGVVKEGFYILPLSNEYTNGESKKLGSKRRSVEDLGVGYNLLVSGMSEVVALDTIDLESNFLYPQQPSQALDDVLNESKARALYGDKEIDGWLASTRWDNNPRTLAKPDFEGVRYTRKPFTG